MMYPSIITSPSHAPNTGEQHRLHVPGPHRNKKSHILLLFDPVDGDTSSPQPLERQWDAPSFVNIAVHMETKIGPAWKMLGFPV